MKQEIESKVKDCTACLASGKSLNTIYRKNYGILKKLYETSQEKKSILPENYKTKTYMVKYKHY